MKFEEAATLVRSGGFSATNAEKLMLYGLFKVATAGPPPSEPPSDLVGRKKWDSWKTFSERYTRDQAADVYPTFVQRLIAKQ